MHVFLRSANSSIKPKPRYIKPGSVDPNASTNDFDTTTNIRDSVYHAWLTDRTKRVKQNKAEEMRKQKEAEDKMKKVGKCSDIKEHCTY